MPSTPSPEPRSLWSGLSAVGRLAERMLWSAHAGVTLGDLAGGSSLDHPLETLRGRSVLVATADQLTAALALIELDGVASRLVLCPPDLPAEQLPFVVATAEVDARVADAVTVAATDSGLDLVVTCTPVIGPGEPVRKADRETEWILLTSGTTGRPKLVVHSLASLAGAITGTTPVPAVWSTFYDIRRYGGLQIFLRAMLGGGSMVLSSAEESTGDFLIRAGALGVTHISGTPSHWRRALMSPSARKIAPGYVRLSGEIADQAILDHLRATYPDARVAHAFASTEAGVAFDVGDGLAGFPASLLNEGCHGSAGAARASGGVGGHVGAPHLKVEDGSLRIRSGRTAARYLGGAGLADRDGFVDTGDMVERSGDRYYFVGRRGGIINVGGLKVHPEEVEAVINTHPGVRMSLVRTRKNPITGALVVADVVLNAAEGAAGDRAAAVEREILALCRQRLPRHKVPAAIRFVSSLPVAATGKLVRHDA